MYDGGTKVGQFTTPKTCWRVEMSFSPNSLWFIFHLRDCRQEHLIRVQERKKTIHQTLMALHSFRTADLDLVELGLPTEPWVQTVYLRSLSYIVPPAWSTHGAVMSIRKSLAPSTLHIWLSSTRCLHSLLINPIPAFWVLSFLKPVCDSAFLVKTTTVPFAAEKVTF